MFKNARINEPLVDPGLYALAHSQQFLALDFLSRELPVLPKWRNRVALHNKRTMRFFSCWRKKQKFGKGSSMRLSNNLSPRSPF